MRRSGALVLGAALFVGSFVSLAGAQRALQSPDVQAVIAKHTEYRKYYAAKDYVAALKTLDEMLVLARKAKFAEGVTTGLYNRACVLALAGRTEEAVAVAREAVAAGFTNYIQFAADTDFASLRSQPDFILFMNDLRERYLPQPLEWDPTRTVSEFGIKFDAPDDAGLAAMRREFNIDAVVAGAADDYARLRALTSWVSRQWPHSPTNMASKADPITILREAKAGGSFICRDYAIVLAGVARAYGLPARVLQVCPRDVETRSEAHSVVEVWLNQFDKWVLADGQNGTIAEIGGVPLNGVELQAAIGRETPGLRCAVGQAQCEAWKAFIVGNLYFFKFAQDQRRFDAVAGPQLVLVPKGASDPHKFAGGNENVFANSVYISDPEVFYRKPF